MSELRSYKKGRAALKALFETGDRPSQQDFEDLIDAQINKKDDDIHVKDRNVGIGTCKPNNKVDVKGNLAVGTEYAGSETSNNAPQDGMIVEGQVGIGTDSPKNKLDVSGSVGVGAGFTGENSREGTPENGLTVEGNTGIGTQHPINKVDVAGNMVIGENLAGHIPAHQSGLTVEGKVKIHGQLGNIIPDEIQPLGQHGEPFEGVLPEGGASLEVDGSIHVTGTSHSPGMIEVDGVIKAQKYYDQDGEEILDHWTKGPDGIKYTEGNVGVKMDADENSLSVKGDVKISALEGDNRQAALGFEAYHEQDRLNAKIEFASSSNENDKPDGLRIYTQKNNIEDKLTQRVVINKDGNVGIGLEEEKSPESKLHVKGDVKISPEDNSSNSSKIILKARGENSGAELVQKYDANTDENVLAFKMNNGQEYTTSVLLDSKGNVGVGKTNPKEKLDVGGTIKAAGIRFDDNGTVQEHPAQHYMKWEQTDSRNKIYHDKGFVGIGTTNPQEILDVDGIIRVKGIKFGTDDEVQFDAAPNVWKRNDDTNNIYYEKGNITIGSAVNHDSHKLHIKGSSYSSTFFPIYVQDDEKVDFWLKSRSMDNTDSPTMFLDGDMIFGKHQGEAELSLGGNEKKRKLHIHNYEEDTQTVYPIYIGDQKGDESGDLWLKFDPTSDKSTLYVKGNLGLGTKAPNAKLDVRGDALISRNLDVSGSITGKIEVEIPEDINLNTSAISAGTEWGTPNVYQDAQGRVFLSGKIQVTENAVHIFTLREKYRPKFKSEFTMMGDNAMVVVHILPDGQVLIANPKQEKNSFSLNNISFNVRG